MTIATGLYYLIQAASARGLHTVAQARAAALANHYSLQDLHYRTPDTANSSLPEWEEDARTLGVVVPYDKVLVQGDHPVLARIDQVVPITQAVAVLASMHKWLRQHQGQPATLCWPERRRQDYASF